MFQTMLNLLLIGTVLSFGAAEVSANRPGDKNAGFTYTQEENQACERAIFNYNKSIEKYKFLFKLYSRKYRRCNGSKTCEAKVRGRWRKGRRLVLADMKNHEDTITRFAKMPFPPIGSYSWLRKCVTWEPTSIEKHLGNTSPPDGTEEHGERHALGHTPKPAQNESIKIEIPQNSGDSTQSKNPIGQRTLPADPNVLEGNSLVDQQSCRQSFGRIHCQFQDGSSQTFFSFEEYRRRVLQPQFVGVDTRPELAGQFVPREDTPKWAQ